jgi:RNA polymerase sigma-70 factor (ECF subfamily)
MVLRRARTILADEQAAKDALQEVFMRVLGKGAEFRQESSPVTWLYRITTNLCLNRLRDSGRRAQLLREQEPPRHAAPPGIDDLLTVRRLLERIPEELREVAIYYHVDQMNQDEIAALIGTSRRLVGYRLEQFKSQARAASGLAPETT